MTNKKIRAIDLFCGAGGSSFGAQNAGAEIVAGFDLWNPAVKTYKANYPKAKVFPTDVRDLSSKNIKKIKSLIGNIDGSLGTHEVHPYMVVM